MHACACVLVLLRVCFPFNAIVCRWSAHCGCALTRKGTRSLLGNTRPRRSAVSSSGIGWRSAVGGDLVTNYNLGSQVLTYWCKSAAWWSAEPQQPVRGDALDVHCCTADRLSHWIYLETRCYSATDSVGSVKRLFIYHFTVFKQMVVIQSDIQQAVWCFCRCRWTDPRGIITHCTTVHIMPLC